MVTDQKSFAGTGCGTVSLYVLPPSRKARLRRVVPEPVERTGSGSVAETSRAIRSVPDKTTCARFEIFVAGGQRCRSPDEALPTPLAIRPCKTVWSPVSKRLTTRILVVGGNLSGFNEDALHPDALD